MRKEKVSSFEAMIAYTFTVVQPALFSFCGMLLFLNLTGLLFWKSSLH